MLFHNNQNYNLQLISRQSTVPEKQKSSISYFSEDPRKFTQFASWRMLIFGIGSLQSAFQPYALNSLHSSLLPSAHSEICSYVAFHVASFCLSSLLPSAYFLLPLISSFPHHLISSSSLLSFALSSPYSPYSPTHSFTAAIISSVISRLW